MDRQSENRSLPIFVKALTFASRKHNHQRRKDAEKSPYINHPIALVSILVEEAAIDDSDVLCAALLHDTVEDTETTREELIGHFGLTIASIVLEVTDNKTLPKEERKRLQIEHAPRLTPKARLVKLAEKVANLRDIANSPPPEWSMDRRREYFDWAKRVVDAIPEAPLALRTLFDAVYERRP